MVTFKNSTRVMRVPGTLIVSPTDLTDAAGTGEYGGSIIGSTKDVDLTPIGEKYRVECEGLGRASDVLETDNRYVVNFFLRGWDKDAVSNLLSGGYSEGSVTGNAVWTGAGATPGGSALGRSRVWLIVPDDTHNHPALIIHVGIPDFADGAEVAFQRGKELGLDMTIDCWNNSSGQPFALGHLADLTL